MNIINPQQLDKNTADLIANKWFLLCAEKDGKANAMTCAWGSIGFIWRQNAVFVFVRDTRYTKEFMDAADTFSISFFDEKYKDTLNYFGTKSGRDEDKIAKSGFTLNHIDNTPVFDEAMITVTCKKIVSTRLDESVYVDKSLFENIYGDGSNVHTMYIGTIINMYEN